MLAYLVSCVLHVQGAVLVREAMASAAVVVWSAALLPEVDPTAAAAAFAKGLLLYPASTGTAAATAAASRSATSRPAGAAAAATTEPAAAAATTEPAAAAAAAATIEPAAAVVAGSDALVAQWQASSLLESMLQSEGTNLITELQAASPLGRLCGLKGLLTAMKLEALCGQLDSSAVSPGAATAGHGYSFLMECALPAAVAAAEAPPDAHFKFHAMGVINVLLQQVKAAWQQLIQLQSASEAAVAVGGAGGGAGEVAVGGTGGRAGEAAVGGAGETTAVAGRAAGVARTAAAAVARISDPIHPAADGVVGRNGAEGSAGAGGGSGLVGQGLVAPWLLPAARDRLMGLMWTHMDEPMAQTLRQVSKGDGVRLSGNTCLICIPWILNEDIRLDVR